MAIVPIALGARFLRHEGWQATAKGVGATFLLPITWTVASHFLAKRYGGEVRACALGRGGCRQRSGSSCHGSSAGERWSTTEELQRVSTCGPNEQVRRVGQVYLTAERDRCGTHLERVAPRRAHRTNGGGVLFRGGLTVSELPMHSLAWQAAATCGFVAAERADRARTTPGSRCPPRPSPGLVGLDRVRVPIRRGARRGLSFQMASDGTIETDGRGVRSPADVAITRRGVANPLPPLRRRYAATRDLSYGQFGRRNQLDIWRRSDLPKGARAPVSMQVHGGTWMSGSKDNECAPSWHISPSAGWVIAAINYRLAPSSPWPAQIVDIEKERSCGSRNTSRNTAVTPSSWSSPEVRPVGTWRRSLRSLRASPRSEPGVRGTRTRAFEAAVPMYGVYDVTNRDHTCRSDMEDLLARALFKLRLAEARDVWDQASPMSWVGADAPPFFIAHGANDTMVSVEHARSFARMIGESSDQPVVYVEVARRTCVRRLLLRANAPHPAGDRAVSRRCAQHGDRGTGAADRVSQALNSEFNLSRGRRTSVERRSAFWKDRSGVGQEVVVA